MYTGIGLFLGCMIYLLALPEANAQSNDTTHILRADHNNKCVFSFRSVPQKIDLKALPANYYTQRMAFFCRQELKMEKLVTIPVLFRVGSINDCNYLEQKPGFSLR